MTIYGDFYAVNVFEKNLFLPYVIHLMLYGNFENMYNKIVRTPGSKFFNFLHHNM